MNFDGGDKEKQFDPPMHLAASVFGLHSDTFLKSHSALASADTSLSGDATEHLHLEPLPVDGTRLDLDVSGRSARSHHNEPSFIQPQQASFVSNEVEIVQCKRCLRGPSYHHGHSKSCPKSNVAKRQRRELAFAMNRGNITCKRCIIGQSYHKAHARTCEKSKYYRQLLKDRERQGNVDHT
jgi:hypothetical protein